MSYVSASSSAAHKKEKVYDDRHGDFQRKSHTPPNACRPPITKAVGARIRFCRHRRGMAQSEFAVLGISYQQLQKYETGVSKLGVDALSRSARCSASA
jgi:DNA-binding transcriptional regulator YiaG